MNEPILLAVFSDGAETGSPEELSDKAWALEVIRRLRQAGYRVNNERADAQALHSAAQLLIFISPDLLNDEEMYELVRKAHAYDKAAICIYRREDDLALPDRWNWILAGNRIQGVLTQRYSSADKWFAKLCKGLKPETKGEPAAQDEQAQAGVSLDAVQPEQNEKKKKRLWPLLVAIGAILLVLGIAFSLAMIKRVPLALAAGNYYSENDRSPERAAWLYEIAAEGGDVQGMYLFGKMLLQRDPLAALDWLEQAATQDHLEAMFEYAQMLLDKTNKTKEGLEWLKKAAQANNSDAQLLLAECYRDGKGDYLEKDSEKALEWLQKAVKQNNPAALYALGLAYINSYYGLDEDMEQAVQLLKKSAELGHSDAAYRYADLHYWGSSVEIDYLEALWGCRIAVKEDHANAINMIGVMYDHGRGVEKDQEEAVRWFTRSIEQNDVYAMKNMGHCYRYGNGVERDKEKAIRYYEKAFHASYADTVGGGVALGNLYRDEYDYKKALEWYQASAEKGNTDAMYYAGRFYELGAGVTADLKQAKQWYQKGADKGYIDSINALERLNNEGASP